MVWCNVFQGALCQCRPGRHAHEHDHDAHVDDFDYYRLLLRRGMESN